MSSAFVYVFNRHQLSVSLPLGGSQADGTWWFQDTIAWENRKLKDQVFNTQPFSDWCLLYISYSNIENLSYCYSAYSLHSAHYFHNSFTISSPYHRLWYLVWYLLCQIKYLYWFNMLSVVEKTNVSVTLWQQNASSSSCFWRLPVRSFLLWTFHVHGATEK